MYVLYYCDHVHLYVSIYYACLFFRFFSASDASTVHEMLFSIKKERKKIMQFSIKKERKKIMQV